MPSSAAVQPRPTPTTLPAMPPMVRCDRRNLSLTAPGCARMWEAAQAKRPERWEGCFACVACPLGAARAGKPLAAAEIAGEKLRGVCVRCTQPNDRLISEGRWCPSCYNRGREVRIGANRKGGPPRLRLRDVCMAVQGAAGAPIEVRTVRQVTGMSEAMLTVAKASSGGAIFFGVPPATAPDQLGLDVEEALPGSTDAEAPADVGRPVVAPAPLREGGIDVGPSHAPGKVSAAQVRREAAIGSRRWLLTGTTGFFAAGRLTPATFDALLPFAEAAVTELR